MAATVRRQDIVNVIRLFREDDYLMLSVFFTGGPVSLSLPEGETFRREVVTADPFFRHPSHYVAAQSFPLDRRSFQQGRATIQVTFANQLTSSQAKYRLELTSLARLAVSAPIPSLPPPVPVPPDPVDLTPIVQTVARPYDPLLCVYANTLEAKTAVNIGIELILFDPFPQDSEELIGNLE